MAQKEIKLLLGSLFVVVIAVVFALPKKEIFQKNYVHISGIVVPHHDLVKAQRAEFFDTIAHEIAPPKTVILISPNHYDAGKADIQTTDKTWDLSNGMLEPDLERVTYIAQRVASEETSSFQNEHGIYLVLPDIKRVWPDAKVVPIILKNNAKIDELAENLKKSCNECLMVASVDFSHYQPAVLANEHDQLSLRALQNLDEELVRSKAEVDSPPSLQLLMEWAKSHNTQKFSLWKHTNSGELLHDPDIETTTHVFGDYESGLASPKLAERRLVSFLIGGDMMFARQIHSTFEKNLQDSVSNLGERLFWGTDLALINLEGAVSTVPVIPDPRPTFDFVFPPETIGVLKFLHINAVSIDNNHAHGVKPEGIPTLPVTIQGEGLKITVIGINTIGIPIVNIKDQISKIKMDPDQRVIIFPHWGVEYSPTHTQQQQDLAHEWIDAGADLVIGSHPHVIEDAEIYLPRGKAGKGKPIFYSLGNSLFDQNWSLPTQQGMLIGGAFTEDGLELFGLPVISKNFQPELARGALKQELLKKIEGGMIKS